MGNSSSSSSSSVDSSSPEPKSDSKLHYKTIQEAIKEERTPISAASGRRLNVTIPEKISTINSHKEIPLRDGQALPSGISQEQAEVLAEIDPQALKSAIDMDLKKNRLRYMVIDTFEIDATWALIATGLIGLFAIPVTKFSIDNTEVNRVYYEETKSTRTHSVYKVTPQQEKVKPNPVAGNTFQSIVASGKNLPIAHALEKIRAQQMRLGFFSIWKGTGAELFWFVTSCSSALALQSFADRIWNREWYNSLARYKKQQRIVKKKEELRKSGAEPTEEDRLLLQAADESFDKPFEKMLPAGADMNLCPDHRWNHWYLMKRAFIENTITGAAGGFLSVLTTYHAEIVATKCMEDYQNALKKGKKRMYSSMMDCYFKTHQQHGLASLYFGVGPVFLRASAFWGLAFGIRSSVSGVWGLLQPNDYVRMMKRQHFDLSGDSQVAKEAASNLQNLSNLKEFSKSKAFKYDGEEYTLMPVLFDFAVSTGSAAIARDAGAVVVRQMVFAKTSLQYLFTTSYSKMRQSGGLKSGEGGSLLRDSIEFGRSAASTVPKRLPFSCLRVGVIMTLFDALRCGHARRWCTKVRQDEYEKKHGLSMKKAKELAERGVNEGDSAKKKKTTSPVSIFPQSS